MFLLVLDTDRFLVVRCIANTRFKCRISRCETMVCRFDYLTASRQTTTSSRLKFHGLQDHLSDSDRTGCPGHRVRIVSAAHAIRQTRPGHRCGEHRLSDLQHSVSGGDGVQQQSHQLAAGADGYRTVGLFLFCVLCCSANNQGPPHPKRADSCRTPARSHPLSWSRC